MLGLLEYFVTWSPAENDTATRKVSETELSSQPLTVPQTTNGGTRKLVEAGQVFWDGESAVLTSDRDDYGSGTHRSRLDSEPNKVQSCGMIILSILSVLIPFLDVVSQAVLVVVTGRGTYYAHSRHEDSSQPSSESSRVVGHVASPRHPRWFWFACVVSLLLCLCHYTYNACLISCYSGWFSLCPSRMIRRCLRGMVALPPIGVVFAASLLPGLHLLPVHLGLSLFQFLLNAGFVISRQRARDRGTSVPNLPSNVSIWNLCALMVSLCHLLFSPLLALTQQVSMVPHSSLGSRTRLVFSLVLLWSFTILPVCLIELVSVLPLLLCSRMLSTVIGDLSACLLVWSLVCRLFFLCVLVHPQSPIPLWKWLLRRANNLAFSADNDGSSKSGKSGCFRRCLMAMSSSIVTLTGTALYICFPLSPTVAVIIENFQKGRTDLGRWNHGCLVAYLLFGLTPMLHLFLLDSLPLCVLVSLAVVYGSVLWVVFVSPLFLPRWKLFFYHR